VRTRTIGIAGLSTEGGPALIGQLTDLSHLQASPQRINELARSQWTIENRLHFVRDTATCPPPPR
jgi:hypothetical protein